MKDGRKLENIQDRPSFKIVSESEEDVSSIDSTNLVSQLSSLYYKTDLVKSIAVLLNQGVSPEKLLISSQSLLSTKDIRGAKTVKWVKDVEILYPTGYLQGAFPDEKPVVLKILADGFRDINSILHQNGYKKMYARFLEPVLSVYMNSDFDGALNRLNATAFSKIERDDRLVEKLFISAKENYQNRYDQYMADKDDLAKLIPLLKRQKNTRFTIAQNNLISQYINPFFVSLENKSYPLVFFNNNDVLSLICHGHFSKNLSKDPNMIDIRSFSHNSPLEIIFYAGTLVVSLLYSYYTFRCKYFEMKEKQLSVKRMEEEATVTKKQKNEYERLKAESDKAEKNRKQYEEYFQDSIIKEIMKIDSFFYKQRLLNMSESILRNYDRLLKAMNIRIYTKGNIGI